MAWKFSAKKFWKTTKQPSAFKSKAYRAPVSAAISKLESL
jgi:hypothetical protein